MAPVKGKTLTLPSSFKFPLTAQSCSSLKKQLKTKDAANERAVLEFSLSQWSSMSKSTLTGSADIIMKQRNYLHQIISLCISNAGGAGTGSKTIDFNLCNKVVATYLRISNDTSTTPAASIAFLEAFAILSLQHSKFINNNKAASASSTKKTPSGSEFEILMKVSSRLTFNIHPSSIVIYLINCIRVLDGLKLVPKFDLVGVLDGPDGIAAWLQKLLVVDGTIGAEMCEHAFRLLYNTVNTNSVINTLNLARLILRIYAGSNKFSVNSREKLIHHFAKNANLKGNDVLSYYNSIASEANECLDSSLYWIEHALNLPVSISSSKEATTICQQPCEPVLMYLENSFMDSTPVLIVLECIRNFCINGILRRDDQTSNSWACEKISSLLAVPALDSLNPLTTQMFLLLSTRLIRNIYSTIDQSFQSFVTATSDHPLRVCNENTKFLLSCLEYLHTRHKQIPPKLSSFNINNLILLIGELRFILKVDVSQIINIYQSVWDYNPSKTILERLGSLSFNIGTYCMKIESYQLAFELFSISIDYYEKTEDSKKAIKPMQGKSQCLYILGRNAECSNAVLAAIGLYSPSEWLHSNLKYFQSFMSIYVSSTSKLDGEYVPLSSQITPFTSEIVHMEIDSIALVRDSKRLQTSVLKFAIHAEAVPVEKGKFLTLLAGADRDAGMESCIAAIQQLAISSSKSTCAEQHLMAKVKCELGISKGSKSENSSIEIEEGLQIWHEILKDIPPYRIGQKLRKFNLSIDHEDLIHYLFYVADNLHKFAFFKLEIFALSLACRLCSLLKRLYASEMALIFHLRVTEAYLILGYSGKAGLTLSIAKSFLADLKLGDLHSVFYLSYGEYLCSIGNFEKATEVRDKIMDTEEIHDQLNFLDSTLLYSKGRIAGSYQKLNEGYRKIMRSFKKNKAPPTTIVVEVLKTILAVAQVLEFQGVAGQIEYYLKQGLELSKEGNFVLYKKIFTMKLADISRRKNLFEESKSYLQLAKFTDSEIPEFTKGSAQVCLTSGNLSSMVSESSEVAQQEYESAETLVNLGISPSFLDNIGLMDELLTNQTSLKLTEPAKAELLGRCNGLECLKGEIICRSTDLLIKHQEVKLAETKLKEASQLSLNLAERSQYYFCLAELKVLQFFQTYSKSDLSNVFEEAVLGTTNKTFFGTNIYSKKKSPQQIKMTHQLEVLVKEALTRTCRSGSPSDAQILAYSLTMLAFFREFVLFEDSASSFELVSFYLELPKRLFHLRQQQSFDGCVLNFGEEAERIPDNLIVCTIDYNSARDHLIVSRQEGDSKILFKLPLRRLATRDGEVNGPGLSFISAMEEFASIMKSNKDTTTNAKFCTSSEQKHEWVRKRKELDEALEAFLNKIETNWLAGFKGLFSTTIFPAHLDSFLVKFKGRLEKLVVSRIARSLASRKMNVVFSIELCKLVLSVGQHPSYDELEDILYFILDFYQLRGVSIAYDEISLEDMREDLEEALTMFYKESRYVPERKHLILIIDKALQHLPWEALPILHGSPVSRVPSMFLLYKCLARQNQLDRLKVYYTLNPSGDLARTEKKMSTLLTQWQGVTGREPGRKEYLAGIQESDIFLYFGHGGGESYIDVHNISSINLPPVMLLFGCSSGYLQPMGEFNPQGIALEFLLAGSPAVLGNLWDVTDVDIDRFSLDCLSRWGLVVPTETSSESAPQISLVEASNLARSACNLKFIVGAAPVVWGVPVYIKLRR